MKTEQQMKIRLIEIGISQTQLAKILNCGVNRVNDAIKGRPTGKKHWKKIAKFLDVPESASPYADGR